MDVFLEEPAQCLANLLDALAHPVLNKKWILTADGCGKDCTGRVDSSNPGRIQCMHGLEDEEKMVIEMAHALTRLRSEYFVRDLVFRGREILSSAKQHGPGPRAACDQGIIPSSHTSTSAGQRGPVSLGAWSYAMTSDAMMYRFLVLAFLSLTGTHHHLSLICTVPLPGNNNKVASFLYTR